MGGFLEGLVRVWGMFGEGILIVFGDDLRRVLDGFRK